MECEREDWMLVGECTLGNGVGCGHLEGLLELVTERTGGALGMAQWGWAQSGLMGVTEVTGYQVPTETKGVKGIVRWSWCRPWW